MEVKVLYFANIREQVGKSEELIRFTGKTTGAVFAGNADS